MLTAKNFNPLIYFLKKKRSILLGHVAHLTLKSLCYCYSVVIINTIFSTTAHAEWFVAI
jgi:ABC-type polysaccharide/polyol phosphate export permease